MNKEIMGIEEFVKNNDVFSKKFLVKILEKQDLKNN